jgi:uncharacterized membrane protein YkoI
MKRWMWLLATALATTVAIPMASTVQADEKNENETPTSMDKIPAAARDGLLREAGGASIVDVVQETENGQTVYEAHVRKGNDVIGIEVDASGKLVKKETEGKSRESQHR